MGSTSKQRPSFPSYVFISSHTIAHLVIVGLSTVSWTMFLPLWTWGAGYSDRIAAIVNKEVITMSELQTELQDERKRLKARYNGAELNRRLLQKEYQVLNSLIERKLQLQAAQTKGLTVTEEEIQNAMRQLPKGHQADRSSDPDMKRLVREELLLRKFRDFEVRQHVMVSDSEIRQYYEGHKDQFVEPPTYRLRQILVLSKAGRAQNEVMARAKSVYKALQAGQDFGELVTKYSDGPEAARGGELGWVRQDELLKPLAQALKIMRPGDMSRPIETSLGFHIIAVDQIKPQNPRSFEEVETEIKAYLYRQRTEESLQRWLADLKQKAYIEIKF